MVDDLVSVLDTDYLDMELIPNITRQIAEQSIYSYIEDDLKLLIDYAQKEITIDHSNDRDKSSYGHWQRALMSFRLNQKFISKTDGNFSLPKVGIN